MDELTPKQKRFVQEYAIDFNGAQAAIRAGYSEKSAREIASEMLTKPNIKAAVDEATKNITKRAEIDQDRVLKEISHYAFLDPGEAFDEQGGLLNVKDMPEHVRRAVASIEVLEEFDGHGKDRKFIGYTKKIKFVPKDKGTDQLGRYLKMFVDRVESKTAADDPIIAILNDIAGRAKLKPNAASAKP